MCCPMPCSALPALPAQVGGIPTAFPAEEVAPEEDLLQTVYDGRPLAMQVGWDAGRWDAGAALPGLAPAFQRTLV